ncbi:MAG: LLM class F420-dependent oxidoreductase [Pseudomonadota bacterium]|jgi:probable F420-dependent oxidoreductase|nr:LLM class F420-dependent oxidoreductase [Pseudomonadota bacterium]
MDIGMTLPGRGPLAEPNSLEQLARRADELGFSHLAVPDHIVVPRTIDSRYPYSASGDFPGAASGSCLDQFSVLSFIAAVTTKAQLVTSVTVIPHRGALETAKLVATIDVLSAGRMTLGVGAGWMREEFDALGAPPFDRRGQVTDEYIEAFKCLWTEDDPRFDGEFVRFQNISFLPKPLQRPHPPIWVGGESAPALRRTVRHGDTWYPIGSNPKFPLDTIERFKARVQRLHVIADEEKRDPASISLVYCTNWANQGAVALEGGARHLLTGSASNLKEDIAALKEAGVVGVVLNFQRDTLAQSLEAMQQFAEDVYADL